MTQGPASHRLARSLFRVLPPSSHVGSVERCPNPLRIPAPPSRKTSGNVPTCAAVHDEHRDPSPTRSPGPLTPRERFARAVLPPGLPHGRTIGNRPVHDAEHNVIKGPLVPRRRAVRTEIEGIGRRTVMNEVRRGLQSIPKSGTSARLNLLIVRLLKVTQFGEERFFLHIVAKGTLRN